jgi:transposase
MSYNLFLNSILFGQGLKRLIQESGTNQRDIFEEIFELGFLTRAKDIAYKKYKEVSSSYDLADTQYKSLSSQISILEDTNSQLSERESNFEAQKSRSIKALKVKLHEFQVKSKSLSKQLEGFLDDDSLEDLIQSYKRKISTAQGLSKHR